MRIRRRITGDVELTFEKEGACIFADAHGAVVIAIPFTVLREIDMDLDVTIPLKPSDWLSTSSVRHERKANGHQFDGRPQAAQSPAGTAHRLRPLDCRTTWETGVAGDERPRNTHRLFGWRSGRNAGSRSQAVEVSSPTSTRFIPERWPRPRSSNLNFRAHLEHWPSNPPYKRATPATCPDNSRPSPATRKADQHPLCRRTRKLVLRVAGFMEGAALSGIDAAKQIAAKVKRRAPYKADLRRARTSAPICRPRFS